VVGGSIESPIRRGKIRLAAGQFSLSFVPVSKASKSVPAAASSAVAEASVPFEDALKRLGAIVEAMEGDELPLDQLLTRFEEGTRLARHCQDQLGAAELRISQLEQTLAGELQVQPLELADESVS
jgi:exodeoxyribonuclease VII small subunit